jgi:hypothetical protein
VEVFLVLWTLAFWLACLIATSHVAERRNALGAGVLLGLLFGPLGYLLAWGIDCRKHCPQCFTQFDGKVSVCPGCSAKIAWVEKVSPTGTRSSVPVIDGQPPPPPPPPLPGK